MRNSGWAFLVILLTGVLPACGQLSDAQIVDNAFPKELIEAGSPVKSFRFSTFAAADLNRTGETLLLALYTNGTRAAVSVISRGGVVLSHPDLRSLKGYKGELELVDLDGDHTPEIIVRLYSGHGPMIPDSWIFAWRNKQLTLISPIQRVHSLDITLLSQISPVDLDGTGKLAILAFPGVQRDDENNLVDDGDGVIYALSNGQYIATPQRFSFAQAFFRLTGEPKAVVSNFKAAPGEATLRIINRAVPGGSPVDSAQIILNGAIVAEPSAFKSQTPVIAIPVQLTADNQLSVELRSTPGSGLWILVGK
ncbi:MAG TPA: hypothetical protein VG323_11755 [Thermoanaerobaculia bacterium]|nr:hypothetical protein [Thermoanaerobaculia bacterium]